MIPLQSGQGHRASSGVEARTSVFLSSADLGHGVPYGVSTGESALILCGDLELRFPLDIKGSGFLLL